MTCFVCNGTNHPTVMIGSPHPVCDDCRELVVSLFLVWGSMRLAVLEAAQAKRGSIEPPDTIKVQLVDGNEDDCRQQGLTPISPWKL
jgi:hypothetical protein